MATTRSTEKILNYVVKQNRPITPTEIVAYCALPTASVREILSLLQRLGHVEIITNGKVSLVRAVKDGN